MAHLIDTPTIFRVAALARTTGPLSGNARTEMYRAGAGNRQTGGDIGALIARYAR